MNYIGAIICAGFDFPPANWLPCDGRLVPISENETLFQLLGNTYGGSAEQGTFALPNLCGRTPIGVGQLAGGHNYTLGESGGAEAVSITMEEYPAHSHALVASAEPANSNAPLDHRLGGSQKVYSKADPTLEMSPLALGDSPGGSSPHSNLQPYVACNWIIAMDGALPAEN